MPHARHPARGSHPAAAAPDDGWHEKLLDGTSVWIRPIRRQDAGLELEFLGRLSPEYRGARFLGLVREPSPDVARDLTDLDPAKAAGFLALVFHDGRQQEIGAAHFRVDAKGEACDCSLTVGEPWQNRGVGALLMQRLIDAARGRGIRRMRAFAPARFDASHQHLAAHLGFEQRLDPRDPAVMIYELQL